MWPVLNSGSNDEFWHIHRFCTPSLSFVTVCEPIEHNFLQCTDVTPAVTTPVAGRHTCSHTHTHSCFSSSVQNSLNVAVGQTASLCIITVKPRIRSWITPSKFRVVRRGTAAGFPHFCCFPLISSFHRCYVLICHLLMSRAIALTKQHVIITSV